MEQVIPREAIKKANQRYYRQSALSSRKRILFYPVSMTLIIGTYGCLKKEPIGSACIEYVKEL